MTRGARSIHLRTSFSAALLAGILCLALSSLSLTSHVLTRAWGASDAVQSTPLFRSTAIQRTYIEPRWNRRTAPQADVPRDSDTHVVATIIVASETLSSTAAVCPDMALASCGYDATAPPSLPSTTA